MFSEGYELSFIIIVLYNERQYLARNNGAKTNDIAKMLELSPARTRAISNNMDDIKSTGEYKERRYWLKE